MFQIRVLPPDQCGADGERLGEITAGVLKERFYLMLPEVALKEEWRDSLEALCAGATEAALRTASNMVWALYREGAEVFVRQQLICERWGGRIGPTGAVEALPPRCTVSEDGHRISEWRVPLSAIADFLAR